MFWNVTGDDELLTRVDWFGLSECSELLARGGRLRMESDDKVGRIEGKKVDGSWQFNVP